MTDFEFYQGDDIIPYYVITDGENNPVDVSSISGATWVATPANTTTPTLTKHLADMVIDVDPEAIGATVKNCIFVHIYPVDMGGTTGIGTFQHELRIITYNAIEAVVYPVVGETATFIVMPSLTWNPSAKPPAPRLERVSEREEKAKEEDPYHNYYSKKKSGS